MAFLKIRIFTKYVPRGIDQITSIEIYNYNAILEEWKKN